MTATTATRCRITKADLAIAADLAKTDGVAVTISANGKTFTVTPVDGTTVPAHGGPVRNRAGGNSCDEAFGT